MSTGTTLFAHIAPRLTDRIEDVAVEALGHILSQSPAARSALENTLREGGTVVDSITTVQTQPRGRERERPDLAGLDDNGAERVLIEAKFWAGLTQNQPNQYLKRLPPDRTAALLFVAPAARLETLWPELCRRAGKAFTIIEATTPGDLRAATVCGGERRLMLTSWAALLDLMETRANDASEIATQTDIRQLRGLTARMDADAFLPWRSEDLGPEFARRMLGLPRLVDDATNRLKKDGLVSTKGLKVTPWKTGYGRFISLGGVALWFGIHIEGWARYSDTPLWLSINPKYAGEKLAQANLLDMTVELGWRRGLPIALPTGVEYDAVLDSVVASLKRIAERFLALDTSQSIEPEQD